MFRPQVTLTGIAVALMLFVVMGGICYRCTDFLQARAQEPKDSKVKELLQERLATLQVILTQTERAYEGGAMPLEQVLQATLAVLKAEFDLCASDKERIKVLEKIVELAKKQENLAATLAKTHQGTGRAALLAKVSRLEAEIALERARAK